MRIGEWIEWVSACCLSVSWSSTIPYFLCVVRWKQKLQPTDWMYRELQSDEVKMKDERETNEMELRRKTVTPLTNSFPSGFDRVGAQS